MQALDVIEANQHVILAEAHAGRTLDQIAQGLKVDRKTLYDYRKQHTVFAQQLEEALQEGAEALLDSFFVDTLDNLGSGRLDPASARVRLETFRFWIEKRWPKKYGQKMDISIEHKVDIRAQLERARQRITAQVIEGQVIAEAVSTDSQSVDSEIPPALTFEDLL